MNRVLLCVCWVVITGGLGCENSGGAANTEDSSNAVGDATTGDIVANEPGTPTDSILTFVMLGDSLTEGIGDTEWTEEGVLQGYPGRLRNRLIARGADVVLTNLGKSGWTSTDMTDGIDWGDGMPQPSQLQTALPLIQDATAKGRQAVACVWIGSNDLFGLYGWCHEPDNEACEADNLAVYEQKLGATLTALDDAGATVVVALLDDQSKRPVVADPAYDDVLPGLDEAAAKLMSAQVVRYNEAITNLAAAHGAHLVNFYDTNLFESKALLDADGIHPNAAGYEQITTAWEKVIDMALGL
ncbi:MAG: hypothetical protein HUU55_13780 [Myxococcales bacterium]|nr:hypothetical protein [Myxococcales bacterium]